ncbi:MAG: type II toxin-antitoxin system VapC family toxin [Bacteriovoracia bacterium]
MAKYLLDTNVIISLIRNEDSQFISDIQSLNPVEYAVSIITHSELMYGCEKNRTDQFQQRIIVASALAGFEIINFDKRCSEQYGKIKASLKAKGSFNPRNELDIQIAATAMAYNLILLTKNLKDFKEIEDLLLQDRIT